jgi:hypothetical protein
MRDLSGLPGLRWAEVPHPLGSLDQTELRQRAELAVEQFADIVLGDSSEPDQAGAA